MNNKRSIAQEFERTFMAVGVILVVLSVFIIDKQKYEALLFACLGGYSLASAITSYAMRIHVKKFYINKSDLTMEIARLFHKHGTTDIARISAMEKNNTNSEDSNGKV